MTMTLLLTASVSADSSRIPAGRTTDSTATTDGFATLSTPTSSLEHDAYLMSFSNGKFDIQYVSSGYSPPNPIDMTEVSRGIYTAGPMNWAMEFSITEVFEFKNNGSASFGPEDTVISRMNLANQTYFVSTSIENTPDWGVRNTFTALSQNGLVTLVFVTNSDFVFYDLGGDIDPREIHLNVRISRYNLSEASDAIGMKIMVKSQSSSGVAYEESQSGAALNITTSEAFAGGTISWHNFALIDGVGGPQMGSWDGSNITLSYPRCNTTSQDLSFFVRSNLTYYDNPDILQPNPVLYLVGLGIAVAIVSVAIVFVKHGRGSRNH